MSVTGSVQYHYHEDSPIGNRSLKVGRICWKGRYKAWSERVTDDESGDERDGMTNGWGGESHETRLVRLMKWSSKMIPRTMWSASKWAICDLQAGNGWRARKSDNRWGAGTARRLKRGKAKIAKLSGCKNIVSEREREVYIRCIRWPLAIGDIW